MRKFFLAVFGVRETEARRALLMLSFNFMAGLALVMTETAGDALFLSRFRGNILGLEGIASLPVIYVFVAMFISAAGVVHFWLDRFLSHSTLITGTLITILLGDIIFLYLFHYEGFSAVYAAFLIWHQFNSTFLLLNSSVMRNSIFNVREGRRTFAFINSGYLLAYIAGGFSIPAFVRQNGVGAMLIPAIVATFIALMLFLLIYRENKSNFVLMEEEEENMHERLTTSIFAEKYLYFMAGMTFLFCMITYFTDFQFKISVGRMYEETSLASFLGVLQGMFNCIKLFMNLFITSRIIARLGMFGSLSVPPLTLSAVNMMIVYAVACRSPFPLLFLLVVISRSLEDTFRETILEADIPLLYQCLPSKLRPAFQSFIASVVQPVSTGFSGLFLILVLHLSQGGKTVELDSVFSVSRYILAACLMLVPLIMVIKHAYLKNLIEMTRTSTEKTGYNIHDPALEGYYRIYLKSGNADRVIFAINALLVINPPNLKEDIRPLIFHKDEQVRVKAIEAGIRLQDRAAAPAVMKIFQNRNEYGDATYMAAVKAICAYLEEEAIEPVSPLLASEEAQIRYAACVALAGYCGLEGLMLVAPHLQKLLESEDPVSRVQAARIIMDANLVSLRRPMRRLLSDPHHLVRRQAIITVGSLGMRALYRDLITCLEDSRNFKVAMNTLQEMGAEILPALKEVFADPEVRLPLKVAIVKLLGRMKIPEASELLLDYSREKRYPLRQEILRRLFYKSKLSRDLPFVEIERLFDEECWYYLHIASMIVSLGSNPEFELLKSALTGSLEDTLERIIFIMSLFYNRKAVKGIYLNWKLGPRGRPRALEIMENMVGSSTKLDILTIFDDLPLEEKFKRAGGRFTPQEFDPYMVISMILEDRRYFYSDWVKNVALYVAGRTKDGRFSESIAFYLSSERYALRETAALALLEIHRSLLSPEIADSKEELEKALPWLAALDCQTDRRILELILSRLRGGPEMLEVIEKTLFLKKVGIFAQLRDEHLVDLAIRLKELTYKKGEKVFQINDVGHSMFIIVSGVIKIMIGDSEIAELRSGECFGEMAVLDMEPRSATAFVAEDCVLLTIDEYDLFDVMSENVEIARGIIRVMSRRLRSMLAMESAVK